MGYWAKAKKFVEYAGEKNSAAMLMGKQSFVDRKNAQLRAEGKNFEVYLNDKGKLCKRKLQS